MVDVVCLEDLDAAGLDIDDPIRELEQDCFHRIITPYGGNLDDPDFGLGLTDMLSGPIGASLATRIEAELRKDSRVEEVRATITAITANTFRIDIVIEPTGALILVVDSTAGTIERLAA